MSTATTLPPATASAPRRSAPTYQPYRWTIAEYRELGKTRLFHDMKTMLIDGEIYAMVMPAPPHDTALTLAAMYLATACPAGHDVRNQQGFDIGTRNDTDPDLAVVPGSVRDYGDPCRGSVRHHTSDRLDREGRTVRDCNRAGILGDRPREPATRRLPRSKAFASGARCHSLSNAFHCGRKGLGRAAYRPELLRHC